MTLKAKCSAIEGVECVGNRTWYISKRCFYTSGKHFYTAVGLSVFFGLFGFDRFYLGYIGWWKKVRGFNDFIGIGLMKLFTFGFFGVGYVLDIVGIAGQLIGPADGSHYVVGYNGPRMEKQYRTSQTHIVFD